MKTSAVVCRNCLLVVLQASNVCWLLRMGSEGDGGAFAVLDTTVIRPGEEEDFEEEEEEEDGGSEGKSYFSCTYVNFGPTMN